MIREIEIARFNTISSMTSPSIFNCCYFSIHLRYLINAIISFFATSN